MWMPRTARAVLASSRDSRAISAAWMLTVDAVSRALAGSGAIAGVRASQSGLFLVFLLIGFSLLPF